jgi:ligand-binding SRPBCC domain-containing protein
MHTYVLEREQRVPKPLADVFAFFSRPENLQAITRNGWIFEWWRHLRSWRPGR